MRNSICKGACALAVATTFAATAAHADNHSVLIQEGGYFPAVSYVNRGDNLIFENNTDQEHIISGPDGSWVSEPIPVDGTWRLNINNQMALTYSGIGSNDEIMEGSFSYDPAPVEE